MNTSMSERWVKRILRHRELSVSLYVAGFSCLMNLAFSLYFGLRTEGMSWTCGMFLALGVQSGYTAWVFWERNAWIRFVEKKDAEIQLLKLRWDDTTTHGAPGAETGIEPHPDA
jgi:hypothetical protein